MPTTTETDSYKTKKIYKPLRDVEVDWDIDQNKCANCIERPCLNVCPVDAVKENPIDKNIEIGDECFGCVLCRKACPYDAIEMETTLSKPLRENVPNINTKLCRQCGACVDACRMGAIHLVSSGNEEAHSVIDEDKCVRCGYCSRVCPTEAIKYGEILPRSVVGGKAIVVNQKKCIGCMTCTRVCPSKGAINVGKMNKLPYINPSYCARCEECMNVCPSTAIRYSSRKRAYEGFKKIKTMEIVSELMEKESEKLSRETVKINSIINKVTREVSYNHTEDEFTQDITELVTAEIKAMLGGELEIEDFKEIIQATQPHREITVIEETCIGCGACIKECPVDCIELEMPSPVHIGEDCVHCGKCVEVCPFQSIYLKEESFHVEDGRVLFKRRNITGPSHGEVVIDNDSCQSCGVCVNQCPVEAMTMENDQVTVDKDKCIFCGECRTLCPTRSIQLKFED
ncbi:MAG: energy-converting hydrogenase subunit [Methanobacterium sp.]|jgi:energy-converting hydrogenase A subunit Q|uniref:4Fe-4S binding protein n=1 Tax=Methanobacterium sp. TaxID=2164 RepID=UPI0003C96883|nr:4Fe-4S binding protein [Methanobacterium sp.]MDI3549631.1 energy-converting hydrogenase subunit [Methanobacterium sp.]CDG65227.1 4Fe-4S ferredoxin [Methanobacterium sp. MB1]